MRADRLNLPQVNRAALDGGDKMQEYARSVDALRQSLEMIDPRPVKAIEQCEKLASLLGKCYDGFYDLAASVLKAIALVNRAARKQADKPSQG